MYSFRTTLLPWLSAPRRDALIYFINDPIVFVGSEIETLPQAKAEQPNINRTPEPALDAAAGIPQSLTKEKVSQPLPL